MKLKKFCLVLILLFVFFASETTIYALTDNDNISNKDIKEEIDNNELSPDENINDDSKNEKSGNLEEESNDEELTNKKADDIELEQEPSGESDDVIDENSNKELDETNKENTELKTSAKRGLAAAPVSVTKEFVYADGNTYYFVDGVMQKGIIEIDGKKYHFGELSGILKKGWSITLDKREYYSDNNGVMQFGWVNADGNTYYIGEDGAYKGIYEIDGKKYHFGEIYKGLKKGWSITLDKREYYSDNNGVMQFGFVNADGNTYYIGEDGAYKGIYEIDGKKYHFGEIYKGLKKGWSITLDKREYYSDENGVMQFGFVNADGNTYYIGEDGAYKGIYEIDGKKYHFGEIYKGLKKGWSITLDKREYYSDENGVMQFGFVNADGNTYYIGEDGAYKGIYEIDGKKYHFGEIYKGLKKGWSITLDKREFYSDENGVMQFGWVNADGNTYYITEEEGAYKGIYIIDGKRYHFGQIYKLLKKGWSVTLDKKYYYSDENGVIQTGSLTIDGVNYNFGPDGVLQTGYQTINGKTYYFYTDGTLAKGIVKIQGERNYFDFNTGELIKSNVKHIVDVSTWQGYLNWDALWGSGQIDGVIIRLGYGSAVGEPCILDNKFEYNLSEIRRLHIPYSVYFYTYAQTGDAAVVEANYVADILNAYGVNDMSFPIFFDAEESYYDGFTYTRDSYALTTTTFANILKIRGYTNVGVYGSVSKLEYGYLSHPVIRIYPIWVAQYYSENQFSGSSYGWQYTSEGRIPGYNGNLDLSIFY